MIKQDYLVLMNCMALSKEMGCKRVAVSLPTVAIKPVIASESVMMGYLELGVVGGSFSCERIRVMLWYSTTHARNWIGISTGGGRCTGCSKSAFSVKRPRSMPSAPHAAAPGLTHVRGTLGYKSRGSRSCFGYFCKAWTEAMTRHWSVPIDGETYIPDSKEQFACTGKLFQVVLQRIDIDNVTILL